MSQSDRGVLIVTGAGRSIGAAVARHGARAGYAVAVNYARSKEKAEAVNKKFVAEAEKAGFVNLAGHRLVGGMRASIYNAMPTEGVRALVEFMKKFEKENA